MKSIAILIVSLCSVHSLTWSADPGSAYVKNSGNEIMHLWVNGSYQGYLKPGETRYSVSDGFITNESGNGRTGNPVEESHGGWSNGAKGKVNVTYQFASGEKKSSEASANEQGEVIFGATNKAGFEPELPSDIDRENAPAILKGNKPNLQGTNPENSGMKSSSPIIGNWKCVSLSESLNQNDIGKVMEFKPDGSTDTGGVWKAVEGRTYSLSYEGGGTGSFTISADGKNATYEIVAFDGTRGIVQYQRAN